MTIISLTICSFSSCDLVYSTYLGVALDIIDTTDVISARFGEQVWYTNYSMLQKLIKTTLNNFITLLKALTSLRVCGYGEEPLVQPLEREFLRRVFMILMNLLLDSFFPNSLGEVRDTNFSFIHQSS